MFGIYIAIGVITLLYYIGKRNKPKEIELTPLKRDNCTQTTSLYEPLLMVEPLNDLMEIDTPSPESLSDMEVESNSEEESSEDFVMKEQFF